MNLLNKLTIKNLKLNKKRTIVTIIGIMLSVALITAVASMYASTIKSLIYFEKNRKGNFHVVYYNVPIGEVETFKNNRSVEKINLTKNIGYAKIDSNNKNKPYAYIKAFTKNALDNLAINVVEGRLPENENEILIPTHLKTNARLSLQVGDSITLNVGRRVDANGGELQQFNEFNTSENINEKIIDTTEKTYKIVGVMERPSANIEQYSAPGYTFITYTEENQIEGNVDLYARYTENKEKDWVKVTANLLEINEDILEKIDSEDEAIQEQVSNELKKAKYNIGMNNYLIELETNNISNNADGGLKIVVIIVIAIIIFTSVFCIKNSFDISITEKIKQYGMLRSVGVTKKQIKRNVFYEATILGIIGIPIGILLGLIATFILIIISNYYLDNSLTEGLQLIFSFSFKVVIISVLLGIITIYFSAFTSARRASKVSPIESIRNSANIKINSKKIKSPKIIKKIFKIGGEISFKNLKRNKRKYRTTVFSIIVSVFVFIALSSFISMAFEYEENMLQISEYNVDLGVHCNPQNDNDILEKSLETTKLDNIEECTILRQSELKVDHIKYSQEYLEVSGLKDSIKENENQEYLDIYTLDEQQYKKYIQSLGLKYDDIKDKAILMDYSKVKKSNTEGEKKELKTLRKYDYKLGEKINGDNEFSIEVGCVTDVKPFGLKTSNQQFIFVSEEIYNKIASKTNFEFIKGYYESNNADKLQDDIDEVLKGEEYDLSNKEENGRKIRNLYTLIGIFLYGFIIVISLIGITNIFNTITTNMELRKQEFAMLKSIGMTTKEFNRMIRLETLFMGVKSLLFGVPIGIGLSYMIYLNFTKGSGMIYKLPIISISLSVCAVFILISLIMKYSINKISKQNIIETIRNENI
ncbi:MAG: ABC transporter permease [Clostridium sp.]|nr:ABC transporter permease [Clostridium sp.]